MKTIRLFKLFQLSLMALVLSLLFACRAENKKNTPQFHSLQSQKQLRIAFSSAQTLELEPCGCTIFPLGGVHRQHNGIQELKQNWPGGFMFLSAGTTFVPDIRLFQKKQQKHFERKAKYLIEAFNKMGLNALSPSADDLALGIDTLEDYADQADFAFVSTNIVRAENNRPIFLPFLEWTYGKGSILILGFSHQPNSMYKNAEIKVADPVVTMRAVLETLPEKSRLILVLSSLSQIEREKIQTEFPKHPLIFLGGSAKEVDIALYPYRHNVLELKPDQRGKTLAHLDLKMRFPFLHFYNANNATLFLEQVPVWDRKMAQLFKDQVKKNLTPQQKKRNDAKITDYQSRIQRAQSLFKTDPTKEVTYTSDIQLLDKRFQEPKNASTKVVENFKEKMRSLALKE